MTARPGRYEVVHTDAGWHARRRYAGNLQIAWETEVLTRMSRALHTIETEPGITMLLRNCVNRQTGVVWPLAARTATRVIEVRYVDERARSQQPTLPPRRG